MAFGLPVHGTAAGRSRRGDAMEPVRAAPHALAGQTPGRRLPTARRGEQVAGVSLGSREGGEHQDQPAGESGHLGAGQAASGHHLPQEHVVHVAQGEEPQGEEEERPLPPPVGAVVVPQHGRGQRRQDGQTQQEVESGEVQRGGQQDQRRHQADVDLHGPPEPGDPRPVRDGAGDPPQRSRRRGSARQPPARWERWGGG